MSACRGQGARRRKPILSVRLVVVGISRWSIFTHASHAPALALNTRCSWSHPRDSPSENPTTPRRLERVLSMPEEPVRSPLVTAALS